MEILEFKESVDMIFQDFLNSIISLPRKDIKFIFFGLKIFSKYSSNIFIN